MDTIINFETAKLLKEKGFDKRTPMVWVFSLGKPHLQKTNTSLELNDSEYNAPTIAEVVMWLYDKHGIWFNVDIGYLRIFKVIVKKYGHDNKFSKFCGSPAEAYEVGIDYSLRNILLK